MPNRTLKQKAYHETKKVLVITLYLWVVFVVLILHKAVVLREHYFEVASHGLALINALALAKVMLIARDLHFADFGNDVPLIYPTLLKSAAFSVLLAVFKILEEVAVGLYHGHSFHESIADLGGGTWSGILSLTAILFVVLIPFFAFAELGELIGEGKLGQLFFHAHPSLKLQQDAAGAGGRVLAEGSLEKGASA
ncbi:MAG: hypothetical protein JO033_04110 [Acidobacteriaceae bacterium]|nr:hypothetical protein [Acidobacteriaceae bacterium]MBV9501550.1 hypothetical protein [Acidobacteriaceae bacterium]